jgi:hypothetical protein
VIDWALDKVGEILANASAATPGGSTTLFVLLVVLVGVAVVLRLRLGPMRRARPGEPGELFADGRPRSAADHRRAADAFAADGRWDEAVTERLRAIVRSLEERAVIDERPGRTAGEAAADAGRALPELAADLRAGARVFDDVRYGGRTADAAADARLRDLDGRCRAARPAPAAKRAPAGTFGVPR